MIISRIKGGLGNQLFQYAVGYSVAKRLNSELALDISFFPKQKLRGYKLDMLNIDFKQKEIPNAMIRLLTNKYINKFLRKANIQKIKLGDKYSYLQETKSDIMDIVFAEKTDNIFLEGYYQSELYFKEERSDLIRQFIPLYPMEDEYKEKEYEIKNTLSVAVHVRRGDFLKAQNDSNPRHYLLGPQYYYNALKYLKEQLPENAIYYWFSDDIPWVKKNFEDASNYQYVKLSTKNCDIDEMMLMKNCKHIIAANSTFSWWASWLNESPDAIRIVPEKRFGNKHMIPDSWIKLPCE